MLFMLLHFKSVVYSVRAKSLLDLLDYLVDIEKKEKAKNIHAYYNRF